MAFLSKFGNILKQTASKQLNGQIQSSLSSPSIFQAIRCMSSSKLFVGGISYSTDEQSMREAFSKYGEVVEARVIVDRETGRSRGFGFVTYTSTEEASSAIQALDGQDLHGRRIKVNYANDRSGGFRSSGFGGNYGAGTGGYGAGAGAGAGGYGAGTGAGGYWGGAGGYGGNSGGYGDGAGGYGAGGYGAGAGGYGAGGYGGGGDNASDNYVQGGGSGGYSQFGSDFGGNSQFGGSAGQLGSDFGGNNQLSGSSGQFGGDFGGNSGQFGSEFGGNKQFDVSSGSDQFSSQFGGNSHFGGDDQIESTEVNINRDNGDWKDDENDASDDTNVAKRA